MDIRELKHLQIDNWVQIDGKPYQVEAIIRTDSVAEFELYVKGIDYDYATHVEAIPITEEWLEKLGFEKKAKMANWSEDKFYAPFSEDFTILKYGVDFWFCTWDNSFSMEENDYFERVQIKAVHQLQNLFYSFTNKELELKQLV